MKKQWFPVSALVCLVSACGGSSQPASSPPAAAAPAPAAENAASAPPPVAAAPAPTPAPAKLKLEVITASPEGFLVNSTLVSGDKEAVLIDAQFTLADGKKVAEAVKASGKALTTVYVTHFHPDHYFGFVALKEAFPSAKFVALPETVAEIHKTAEEKVKQWKPMYKDGIPSKPLEPEALNANSIELEGQKLEIVGPVQGDDTNNSYVWIPSLNAVVAGDIVYDGVFPWTAETTPETRKAWLGSLDKLAALHPAIVVPGHQKADKKQDPADLQFTKDYLVAFDEALASSKKPSELQSKIKAKYPDTALDVILKIGSEAAFKKAPGKAAKAVGEKAGAEKAAAKPSDKPKADAAKATQPAPSKAADKPKN